MKRLALITVLAACLVPSVSFAQPRGAKAKFQDKHLKSPNGVSARLRTSNRDQVKLNFKPGMTAGKRLSERIEVVVKTPRPLKQIEAEIKTKRARRNALDTKINRRAKTIAELRTRHDRARRNKLRDAFQLGLTIDALMTEQEGASSERTKLTDRINELGFEKIAARFGGKSKREQHWGTSNSPQPATFALPPRPMIKIQTALGKNASRRGALENERINLRTQLIKAQDKSIQAKRDGRDRQVAFWGRRTASLRGKLEAANREIEQIELQRRGLDVEYKLRQSADANKRAGATKAAK